MERFEIWDFLPMWILLEESLKSRLIYIYIYILKELEKLGACSWNGK
jgi:hypothetical protein